MTGNFTGPAVTGTVAYGAGAAVTFSVNGEWPRAMFQLEYSTDAGTTWTPAVFDIGIGGAAYGREFNGYPPPAQFQRPTPVHPAASPGIARLRCVEFTSGWCEWTLSA